MKSIVKIGITLLFTLCGIGSHAEDVLDVSYTEMPLREVSRSGTLILSDCPEYATVYGILAEGTVEKGKGRIYYYHVNETENPARLVVYAVSDKRKEIKITRTLRGIPSQNYIPTGKSLSNKEVIQKRQTVKNISLSNKKREILFEDNPAGIAPHDLVSGIVEIETNEPVTCGVAFLPYDESLQKNISLALKLPPDSHEMRGTFPLCVHWENKVWNVKDGPTMIYLGSPESINPFFLKGRDELNFINRENTGNYGVTCCFTIHSKGTGTYDVYLNPMGGSFEGAIEMKQDSLFWTTYITKGQGKSWFGEDTVEDYMKIGRWKAGKDLNIRFIPPGASSFPVRLLFLPVKK